MKFTRFKNEKQLRQKSTPVRDFINPERSTQLAGIYFCLVLVVLGILGLTHPTYLPLALCIIASIYAATVIAEHGIRNISVFGRMLILLVGIVDASVILELFN